MLHTLLCDCDTRICDCADDASHLDSSQHCPHCGQRRRPVPAATPTQNLKDAFAIHALHVLGLIEGETDKLDMSQDGRLLYPRVPNEAINDLHDEAQTKEELAVVEDLLFPLLSGSVEQ